MKPLRVLVVEDEALIAMLYAEVLASLGHNDCVIARTEEEAVEAAQAFHPDLMIVDEHLQEGSGQNAVMRILAEGYMPHVFVSGDNCGSGGAAEPIRLQKPFNEAQLVRAIEAAMSCLSRPVIAPSSISAANKG